MQNVFLNELSSFIENDNRKNRRQLQVTAESMLNRCEAFLPTIDVKGKRILDLGCCIGAMGAWCLYHGATFYTGVEIQKEYSNKASSLLGEKWNNFEIINADVITFLETVHEKYDIIIILGVIFAITDILSFIKKCTEITNDYLIIDAITPAHSYLHLPFIELRNNQKINSAQDVGVFSGYSGLGLTPSIEALQLILSNCGFDCNQIFTKPVENSHDPYNDFMHFKNRTSYNFARYVVKGTRIQMNASSKFLADALREQEQITEYPEFAKQYDFKITKSGEWKFDENVAKRFRQEALNNIPDYIKVIEKSKNEIKKHFGKDYAEKFVVDIGSALGETVDVFLEEGFKHVYGIEVSDAMILQSKHITRIINSGVVPTFNGIKWDAVVMNWTLHFIKERKEHLQLVYDSMSDGGIFIITDKMNSTSSEQKKYVNFKRERGMSNEEIKNKALAIQGVLITQPLSWYLQTLEEIGFKNIRVINTRFMFNTIECTK